MNTPVLHLNEIIDTRLEQPPIWVAYPGSETFQVLVRPLGNRQQDFIESAQRIDWDLATMSKKLVVDQEQYLKLFCEWVIVDWLGLTMTDLRRLVLVQDPKKFKNISGEFACDEAAKLLLMNHSPVFNTWINRVTRDIERFNIEREAGVKKKLRKPSNTGSTTQESTASSARKTSKKTESNRNVKDARLMNGTGIQKWSLPCSIFHAPGVSLIISGLKQPLTTLKSLFTNGPNSGVTFWPCTAV